MAHKISWVAYSWWFSSLICKRLPEVKGWIHMYIMYHRILLLQQEVTHRFGDCWGTRIETPTAQRIEGFREKWKKTRANKQKQTRKIEPEKHNSKTSNKNETTHQPKKGNKKNTRVRKIQVLPFFLAFVMFFSCFFLWRFLSVYVPFCPIGASHKFRSPLVLLMCTQYISVFAVVCMVSDKQVVAGPNFFSVLDESVDDLVFASFQVKDWLPWLAQEWTL